MSAGEKLHPLFPRGCYMRWSSPTALGQRGVGDMEDTSGVTTPGPASMTRKPVTMSRAEAHLPPVITVGPVLVTVDPASIAHPAAAPAL